ncbi:DUF2938 domain-containing protein [Pseudomonas cremoricolorata]|uniref:Membrane protein n=1 Tax=Pseudomonas cremoricolorata TaxID=157783 RepID=A0A089WW12_9PSED|nr:DUF2938 domain-containing protein [Pseudomonas cremoricolorata]AIR91444.1 membrane protein [Pseudomonas cremoricolorata]
MNTLSLMFASLPIGVGATLLMDAWTWLLKRRGVRTLDYAMVGRWVGHVRRGVWRHASIATVAPVAYEGLVGWSIHYLAGVVFALVFVLLAGEGWLMAPTLWPALAFGVCTVLLPLCLMQPALGAGLFARRTATPLRNCLRSVATHSLFGVGLFLAAWVLRG